MISYKSLLPLINFSFRQILILGTDSRISNGENTVTLILSISSIFKVCQIESGRILLRYICTYCVRYIRYMLCRLSISLEKFLNKIYIYIKYTYALNIFVLIYNTVFIFN